MIARNVRLEILRRAREIIGVKENWTTKYLRKMENGAPRYCVLGAIEQAAYDVGYIDPTKVGRKFADGNENTGGYLLGKELSLNEFARERHGSAPWQVNDRLGYETTLKMLDDYIVEIEEGRAREPGA